MTHNEKIQAEHIQRIHEILNQAEAPTAEMDHPTLGPMTVQGYRLTEEQYNQILKSLAKAKRKLAN